MFGRYQHDKILVVNRPCTQTVEIDRQRDADHVELVLTQLLQQARGEVLLDHQRHLRHGLAQYRHEVRSEEHTSELQSLMRISYAVFCLNTKTKHSTIIKQHINV